MGFGNPAALDAEIARKVREPRALEASGFSTWSFAKAGAAGVPSGAMEVVGSGADFLRALQSGESEYERRLRDKAGIPRPDFGAMGAAARRKADEFAPDPVTAHTADKVIHGVTRFTTKAVGAVATAGPVAGAALLGAEEANTTAQRLIAEGVDPATAAKVGAVTGIVSAGGAVVPAAGATVAKTVGIAIGAGPAAYVAQEGLSREILQRAGYADLANQHDPTDLLGLTLSTIPGLAVGGLHHALRKPLKTEADVREAAKFTPAEQAASDAYERSATNLAELKKAIDLEKRPAEKAILQAELDKLTAKTRRDVTGSVAEVAARDPDTVAAARVQVTEQHIAKSLPDVPNARALVRQAEDDLAAGVFPDLPPIRTTDLPEFRAWFGDSKVVDEAGEPLVLYHGTNASFNRFDPDMSREGDGVVFASPNRAVASDFALFRTEWGGANVMPIYAKAKRLLDVAGGGRPIRQVESGEKIDGMKYGESLRNYAKRAGYDGIRFRDVTDDVGPDMPPVADVYALFNPEQIKSATGNSGKFDPASDSLTDPLAPGERSPRYPKAGTNLLPDDTAQPGATQAGGTKSGGETATPGDSARLQQIAQETPDLRVRLPGSDETMTVTEALARAKEAAADEKEFADLIRVAADCAVSFG